MNVTLVSPQDLESLASRAASLAIEKFGAKSDTEKREKWGWISNSKAKQLLGLSTASLQRYRTSGVLPFSRIGGALYYKQVDLEAILERNLRTGTSKEVSQ